MCGDGGASNRWDGGEASVGMEEISQRRRSTSHGGSELSSGSSDSRRRKVKVCGCGVQAPLLTSWTGENPGRRFYGCGLFKVHGRKMCKFFEWFDDVGNEREKVIARRSPPSSSIIIAAHLLLTLALSLISSSQN
ncbi:hypothetical protein OROGR_002738 [Orobanche gracilis]